MISTRPHSDPADLLTRRVAPISIASGEAQLMGGRLAVRGLDGSLSMVHIWSTTRERQRERAGLRETGDPPVLTSFALVSGGTAAQDRVPPVGFEPTHPAPEAGALSPELRGPNV